MSREVIKRDSKEYPPDRDGNITRETVEERVDGSVYRTGGIEDGPDRGRGWSKWDEKASRVIEDAPGEAELWETGNPSRIETLRAQRYGFITAQSENGKGQKIDDAWLHAEADVETLPADPFTADDLDRMKELTRENPLIEINDQGIKTTYRRNEHGDRVTVQIERTLEDGTKLIRGEHQDEARQGTGWITREAPTDRMISSEVSLPIDDGNTIGELRLKKTTFNFGPEAQRRLFVEFIGRRESKES